MNRIAGADIQSALAGAWHQQSAHSSLERWLEVCEQEQWGAVPERLPLLVQIFGASWYFTRFIFFRGRTAAQLVDSAATMTFDAQGISDRLRPTNESGDEEQQLDWLRVVKNEIMLQILACYLEARLDQQQAELALTDLADATLFAIMRIFDLHHLPGCNIAALGMGRMAGDEMTFGSDLDLIFLFDAEQDEFSVEISRKIRLLLRYLASASSAGALYDVDMRLRPHGTSGALLTSTRSFLEYHQGKREIWERQMMTRCRPVADPDGMGRKILQQIMPSIYVRYDEDYLRREIVAMRHRVEAEKGNPRGKIDIKRGRGGIMDIDFLSHFLQLKYGHEYPELITGSTRTALQSICSKGLISDGLNHRLLQAYDFLKQVEACARLFDMKPVSTISARSEGNVASAAATGFGSDTDGFMQKFHAVTADVRQQFIDIVGKPE